MKYAKIKGHPNLVRDMETKIVLNTNKSQIDEFNAKRKKILEEQNERQETKNRLAKIEQEMSDIKQLLKEIAQLRSENAH